MDKCKIIVHNPCNDITRHFKNYNFFWDYFTEFLKQYFDVEENRYFEDIHKMPYNVNLKKGFTNNLNVYDCEYIIENKETGDFHIISVSDIETSAMLNEASNPFCKNILVSQFNPKRLFMWKNEIPHKDIGYYNLKDYDHRKYMKVLADKYNIYGFCYYHCFNLFYILFNEMF